MVLRYITSYRSFQSLYVGYIFSIYSKFICHVFVERLIKSTYILGQ